MEELKSKLEQTKADYIEQLALVKKKDDEINYCRVLGGGGRNRPGLFALFQRPSLYRALRRCPW